jgi:hypothetical protein
MFVTLAVAGMTTRPYLNAVADLTVRLMQQLNGSHVP